MELRKVMWLASILPLCALTSAWLIVTWTAYASPPPPMAPKSEWSQFCDDARAPIETPKREKVIRWL